MINIVNLNSYSLIFIRFLTWNVSGDNILISGIFSQFEKHYLAVFLAVLS